MKKINKKTLIIIFIIPAIIGGYYIFSKNDEYLEKNSIENNFNTNETLDISDKKKIIVYITGAVANEGIYELDENSRIADCIEKAGGLSTDANIKNINLAYLLEDGMKIYIPKISDSNQTEDETSIYVSNDNEENKSNENNTNINKENKININTATQTELETLPGIGPSTATKIINYRKEKGKFKDIEDIKNVRGIGDSKYKQIKDLIKI